MELRHADVVALRSHLCVKRTTIGKSRFPIIDMHSHPYARTKEEIRAWANHRTIGLAKVVLLTGLCGREFQEAVHRYESVAPEFWIPFAGLLPDGVGESNYARRAVSALDQAVADGARGVGEIVDKGSGPFGNGILFDDPCFDPVWDHCGLRRLPVNIHVGEPPAFYEAPDRDNELERSGRWSLHGQDIPSLSEMLDRLEAMVRRHPSTTFVLAHLGNVANDLDRVARLLDRCPNIVTDCSARIWELARQPYTARRFFIRYQNRIVFGTDLGTDGDMIRQHIRFFETEDEWFSPPDAEWWMGYGIHLPATVLRRVYAANARRLLRGL